jgi:DNA-directed RNA polymerase subunit RPC12/RpoP
MMPRYQCGDCEAIFYDPVVRERRENLDGYRGIWNYTYFVCPECGSEDVNEYWEDDDAAAD